MNIKLFIINNDRKNSPSIKLKLNEKDTLLNLIRFFIQTKNHNFFFDNEEEPKILIFSKTWVIILLL